LAGLGNTGEEMAYRFTVDRDRDGVFCHNGRGFTGGSSRIVFVMCTLEVHGEEESF
jgi:hypothetical protein